MQGLPQNINLDPLIDRTIESLTISRHSVVIFLGEAQSEKTQIKVKIETESDEILFVDSAGISHNINNFQVEGGFLCHTLGLTIQNAIRRNDGGLIITLSTGVRLEIGIHISNYESIVLHIGEEVIVG
jgi:hypothetical protein